MTDYAYIRQRDPSAVEKCVGSICVLGGVAAIVALLHLIGA